MDTDKLREAVRHFVFCAKVGGASSEPCTVKELNNAIDQVAKVLNVFIDELEQTE